jgi:gluconate 2-dehydrogenase gamma chain
MSYLPWGEQPRLARHCTGVQETRAFSALFPDSAFSRERDIPRFRRIDGGRLLAETISMRRTIIPRDICVAKSRPCRVAVKVSCSPQNQKLQALIPEHGRGIMTKQGFDRRELLKGAVVGAAAATGTQAIAAPETTPTPQPAAASAAPSDGAAYTFLNIDEAAFVEALVDHMVPADEVSPKGTDLGINVYIDRALAGGWGKGERLYMQGPWKLGTPSQGYQLPLTPAQLYRAGIADTNAYCIKTYGKTFDRIDANQRQDVLMGLSTAKITFENGLPVRVFWATLYQTIIEGMYSDPIYGGNRNKAGWAIIGFPGVIAVHRDHVEQYRGKPFPNKPLGIADMS